MSTMTLSDVETRYSLAHLEHLDRQAQVPTVKKIGFQGDVAIVPAKKAATTPIPTAGFPVVRGENGGNTHLLIGKGFFDAASASGGSLLLGIVTVPANGECLLSHPEHGSLLLAPGNHEIRRQREQADEIRMVQD